MSFQNLEVPTSTTNKRWLNPSELEAEYGFSKSSQSKMRMRKSNSTIPFSKIGRKYIRYDRVAIDKWLEEHSIRGDKYAF